MMRYHIKPKRALVVFMPGFSKQVTMIQKILSDYSIASMRIDRSRLKQKVKRADLVITVGGDGTFLVASHYIDETQILGVNPDPKKKEGFFTGVQIRDFKTTFDRFMAGDYKIIKLSRLSATINKKEIDDLALNEFYIGNSKGYHMSHYNILINGKKEFQKSSGIIIGTAAGSHSWLSSAGGKKLSIASKRYQYAVREPYHGRLSKARNTGSLISKDKSISVVPLSNQLVLVIDSLIEILLKKNQKITIKRSKKSLNTICFGK